jgi:hypothetical protein
MGFYSNICVFLYIYTSMYVYISMYTHIFLQELSLKLFSHITTYH